MPASGSESGDSTTGDKDCLHVVVHSASDLLAKDLYGTSDPFVKISVDQLAVAQTKTKKGDLNPVWNQHIVIPLDKLPQAHDLQPQLKLEILNEYRFGKVTGAIQNIGKQAFLGQVCIALADLLPKGAEQMYARRWFELQKRSPKSRVRGRLQLTAYIVRQGVQDDALPAPSQPPLPRRTSHYSVAEMAEVARICPEQRIGPGKYSLRVALVRASKLPVVDQSKHAQISFQVSIEASKGKSPEYQAKNIDEEGNLGLNEFEVPVNVDIKSDDSLPNVRLSMTLPKSGLFDYTLGRASIHLGNVPVLPEDDQAAIDSLVPVDVYLEKKKVTLLPPYMHLRDSSGSVCRLRVKMWLVARAGDFDDDMSDISGEIEDDDDDDDGTPYVQPDLSNLPPALEWVVAEDTVKASFSKLHRVIFADNSKFMQAFCGAKHYTEVSISPWSEEGKREVAYLIAASSLVKANHAVESQEYVVKPETSPGVCVVNVATETLEVMNGKDFVVLLQFQLSATSKNTTHLKITGDVKFNRSIMLRSMIQKGVKMGLGSTYEVFMATLRKHLGKRVRIDSKATDLEEKNLAEMVGTGGSASPGLLSRLGSVASFAPQFSMGNLVIYVLLLAVVVHLYLRAEDLAGQAQACNRLLELALARPKPEGP